MGGKVLELPSDQILAKGKAEGRAEGLEISIHRIMLKNGSSFEDACNFLDITPEEAVIYYDGVMNLNKNK